MALLLSGTRLLLRTAPLLPAGCGGMPAQFSSSPAAEAGYKLKTRSAAAKRYRSKNGGKMLVHGRKGGKEIRTTAAMRQTFARVLPFI